MRITSAKVYESKTCTISRCMVDGAALCFFLQDGTVGGAKNGKHRIDPGSYRLVLRTVGSKHEHYLKKYGPDFHKGMVELQDVPNFTAVLIHIGNSPADSLGCLLTGTSMSTKKEWVGGSEAAYRVLYPFIRDAILREEEVWIEIAY